VTKLYGKRNCVALPVGVHFLVFSEKKVGKETSPLLPGLIKNNEGA